MLGRYLCKHFVSSLKDAVESQRMARGQKEHLDREVRKYRRRRLIKYHELEQDLLREVKNEFSKYNLTLG